MQSPVFFISKRDIVNKRISFMTNEGDFLSINNSIDDEILGPEEDIVRC